MSVGVRFISEVVYRNTFNPTTKGLTLNELVVATFIEHKRQVVHAKSNSTNWLRNCLRTEIACKAFFQSGNIRAKRIIHRASGGNGSNRV